MIFEKAAHLIKSFAFFSIVQNYLYPSLLMAVTKQWKIYQSAWKKKCVLCFRHNVDLNQYCSNSYNKTNEMH